MLGALLLLGLTSCLVTAQPATLRFNDCFSGDPAAKLNVSNVYAQLLHTDQNESILNLTVFGRTGQEILGSSNQSNSLGQSRLQSLRANLVSTQTRYEQLRYSRQRTYSR